MKRFILLAGLSAILVVGVLALACDPETRRARLRGDIDALETRIELLEDRIERLEGLLLERR